MTGKFIVIEGLEGAGKSSAISIVKSAIEAAGHNVICTREPGGTPMAEAIRNCVKQDWESETVTQQTELLLMYAARSQLLENVILPNLQKGTWVVGDRHDMSSLAYQGGGRQIPDNLLQPLRQITLQGFEPDLVVYMDVNPQEGLKRARGRGELDRIEKEDISFFERTRERYLSLATERENTVIVDTMTDMKTVHQKVQSVIREYLSC